MSNYRISEEELFSELERLDEEIPEEKSPRRNDMREEGKYSFGVYVRRFGSWNNALGEAGFELNKETTEREPEISDDELISEMKELNSEKERNLRMADMREDGKYSFSTYQKRFGSWNNAMEKAGLEKNKEIGVTDSDVVKDIQTVSDEYCDGGSPTSVDMINHGKYSERIYLFNDTNWDEYLEKAGFEKQYGITEEQLISAIHELANQLEKTPSSRDMKKEGKYTTSPYKRVFGSWKKALMNAGYEPIGYVSGEEHPNWEGGTKDSERRKFQSWSKRVKGRDGYECQRCEEPRSRVRFAHHIKSRSEYPGLAFQDENGTTLCPDCHAKAHEGDTVYNSLKALAEELAEKSYDEVYYG